MRRTLLVLAAVLLPAALVAQQPFEWSGRMRDGATLKLYSSNGPIEVMAASGDRARVHGEILESYRDREPVRFELVEDGDDIIVCALTERHVCEPDGIRQVDRQRRGRDGPERALMRVELPAGVDLVASSGNGGIRVEEARGDVRVSSGNGELEILGTTGRVEAHTGNGEVEIRDTGGPVEVHSGNGEITVRTALGPVEAHTGNGDIDVVMDRLGSGDLEFTTGNGSVVVEVPDGLNADLRVQLGHGDLETDFPITIRGRTDFRDFRATIGDGGRRLIIRSGNGDAVLRRR